MKVLGGREQGVDGEVFEMVKGSHAFQKLLKLLFATSKRAE